MKKTTLLAPGPTPVPPETLLAMARPIIHHREPEFKPVFEECRKGLQYLLQTNRDVVVLAASGTGAMEASITNFLRRGDKALYVNGGKFGERWGKILKAYGCQAVEVPVEWGRAVDPATVRSALDADPEIRAVYVQASETSTGVRHPVEALAAITRERPGVLLVVDGITAVGVFDLPMDSLGIDVLVTGSQKALMLPPGLAFIAWSEKAEGFLGTADLPRFYFDVKAERKKQLDNQTAWTPAVSLVVGLADVLRQIREETREGVFARTRPAGEGCAGRGEGAGPRTLRPRQPERCLHRREDAGRSGRPGRQEGPAGAVRDHGGRRAGPGKGQDHPHRPPGLRRHLRRGDRRLGPGDGARGHGPEGRTRQGRGRRAAGPGRQAMKKVLVSDSLAKEGVAILQAAEELQVDVKTGLKPEELKAIIGEYDALVIRSATKVTADLLFAAATNLKVIGRAGIGVDNVDVPAATKRGVVVMNTPGGNTVTTAEHAVALMMSLVRIIPQATVSMKQGQWEKKKFQGREIFGKGLGVVGLGNIGSIVADRALGLKMKVIAYDPFISPERAAKMGVELVDLDDLFRRADIVTIHVPLMEETRNLVNRETLAKMKAGSFLVCAARGGIVDEEALLEALETGRIAGAALDVFSRGAPGALHPWCSHPKVICTPHLGASTAEAQEAVAVQVAEQIVDYFRTGTHPQRGERARACPPTPSIRCAPYLDMARSLGRLQAQLGLEGAQGGGPGVLRQGRRAGAPACSPARPCRACWPSSLGERVNLVNAPVVARDRGIRVVETTAANGEDYTALIRLKVDIGTRSSTAWPGPSSASASPAWWNWTASPSRPFPRGHLLVFWNWDRPGLVGSIGTDPGTPRHQHRPAAVRPRSAWRSGGDGGQRGQRGRRRGPPELRQLPNVISVIRAIL